jgi:hypothetical protein
MTLEEVRAAALRLPDAAEETPRGTHSFTVRRKLFLRLMQDGETLALRTDRYERDHLLSTAPEVFFVGSQIEEHPWVFVRLSKAEPAQLRELIQDAWRRVAPRRLVDDRDGRA